MLVGQYNSRAIPKCFILKDLLTKSNLTYPRQTAQNENARTLLQECRALNPDGGPLGCVREPHHNDTAIDFLFKTQRGFPMTKTVQLFTLADLASAKGVRIDKLRRDRDQLPTPSFTSPGGQGQWFWTAERLRSGGLPVPKRASALLDLS